MTEVYKNLLSSVRFRPSEVSGRNILLEAESDRGRLLFCPAFRRLQQKAQVFSMEPNAAVRSRLTHSLEVAQIGRYIADQISIKLLENKWASVSECTAFTTFIETACLMHDIGNPPFGHFGEFAISEWFDKTGRKAVSLAIKELSGKKNGDEKKIAKDRIESALADFLEFDGNPQGIRIVAKLQRNSDSFGLNLTKTTIGAYLKYVRSTERNAPDIDSPFIKKSGYFSTEKNIVESVWQEFGYQSPQRFPLAYVMEAADDIAYCISDLEDSIEKGLLDESKALNEILSYWDLLKFQDVEGGDKTALAITNILQQAVEGVRADGKLFTYTDFRTSLTRVLVKYAAKEYIDSHVDVLAGKKSSLISSESPCGSILEILKSYCRDKVYCHESVQKVELAGFKAITGLLDQFSCLLEVDFDRFSCALLREKKDSKGQKIVIENKLLTLFPKNYVAAYKDQLATIAGEQGVNYLLKEWVLRAHLITDFVSGMTDDFATTTYQTLSGMKL